MKKLRSTSIRQRLTLVYTALFAVSSAVLIATSYAFVANQGPTRGERDLRAERVRAAFGDAGLVADNPERALGTRPLRDQLPDEVEVALATVADDARSDVLQELLTQSLIAFALTATASVALAWWVARQALRPVDDITAAAGRLSESSLNERLDNPGPNDELHRLRASFNAMLGRLETGFEARRRFAADASHELRTPLAVLRAQSDNAKAGATHQETIDLAENVATEVVRAERLIEALLALSRVDEASPTNFQMVDLSDVVGDIVGALAPEADERKLDIDLSLPDSATVRGEEALLGLLVRNAVSNAIVHNVGGGWLRVVVSVNNGWTRLCVANSGAVLDPDELAALFARFERGRAADGRGHGLGLPLVDAIARAHGADLVAEPRVAGGLELTIDFPG